MAPIKNTENGRAGSPQGDFEDLEPHEDQPEQLNRSSKKSKKRPPPKPVDSDEEDVDEEVLPEGLNENDAMIFKIRQASSKLCKANGGRNASNADIAEEIGEEEDTVKNHRDHLKLARQGARLSGARKSARKAGFSSRKNASRDELHGLDMERSILSPADIVRLAHAVPLSFDKGSYNKVENEMRFLCMFESLPHQSARELTAFVESEFRAIDRACVERNSRLNTTRVSASTMGAVVKNRADRSIFSSFVPPPGLVRHAKDTGVGTYVPGRNEDPVELMEVTAEDKKQYRADKKENKEMADSYDRLVKKEADRKAAAREKRVEAASAEFDPEAFAAAAEAMEQDEDAAASPVAKPKKSKKHKMPVAAAEVEVGA